MTFIYEDQNLILELIRTAQAAAPSADDQKHIELAKQLVKNLQTEMAGGTVFTADKDDADLDQIDLVNLDSFFNFLLLNGIKANGKSLVFKYANFDLNALGADAKLYVQYPQDSSEYYINRSGVVTYLENLKKKSAGNPILLASASRLLQQINTEMPGPAVPHGPGDRGHGKMGPGGLTPVSYKQHPPRGGSTTQDLKKLLGKLPLLPDRIDFNRIKNFLTAYTQVTGRTPANIGAINDELDKIENDFRIGPSQGLNGLNPDSIATVLPPGTHPRAYAISLYALVYNVIQLINYLKSVNYDNMDDQLKEQMDRQVGADESDGSSISSQNMDVLTDFKDNSNNWRRTK